MTKKTANTPHEYGKRKRSLWIMALAICGAHGIPASIRQDVAAEIASNAYRTPRRKLQAFAHRTASRRLAADLGFTEREIPASRAESHAIAGYEYQRMLREVWQSRRLDNEDWVGGFDYHSRRFAIENGVCPRCSASGDFRPDAGACECGYSY